MSNPYNYPAQGNANPGQPVTQGATQRPVKGNPGPTIKAPINCK